MYHWPSSVQKIETSASPPDTSGANAGLKPIEIKSHAAEVESEVVDVASIANGKPLVRYSATEAGLNALRTDLKGKTYDLAKTRDNEAARSDRLRCVTLRTTLEKRRKEFKAPALAFGKLIDTEADRITNEILMLEQPIDTAIKADEQRRAAKKAERERIEADRVAKHEASIARIRGMVARCEIPGMTAARIADGIRQLHDLVLDEQDLDEFYQQALAAKVETLSAMNVLCVAAEAREAEAARVEAQRVENERVAAENARIAAELKRQADELAAQRAESERLDRLAQDRREAEAARIAAAEATAKAAQNTERQGSQQVLKAEPAMADATDRDDHANTSPRGGAMGAGQPAAAGPAVDNEPATLRLSVICERIGITMTAAFVSDTLGVPHSATDKAAKLYRESDFPRICMALASHAAAMSELYSAVSAGPEGADAIADAAVQAIGAA